MNVGKAIRIQIFAASLLALLALFYAFTQSIEEPFYVGEDSAIHASVVLHVFWLLPFIAYYVSKKSWAGVGFSFLLYFLLLMPTVAYRYYTPRFDAERWRTGISNDRKYVNVPAHTNGAMVQDIIESRALIGMGKADVARILGTLYYCDSMNGKQVMQYYYSKDSVRYR